MRPKNKYQEMIVEVQRSLPPLTEAQRSWAYYKVMPRINLRTTANNNCTECNQQWKRNSKSIDNVCPYCNSKLTIVDTLKRWHTEDRYFGIVTVAKNIQIIRIFKAIMYYSKNKIPDYYFNEVINHFIDEKGKYSLMHKNNGSGIYQGDLDSWANNSDIEFRTYNSWKTPRVEQLIPHAYYPKRKIIPILKRNGFTGALHDVGPRVLSLLILDNKIETLFKIKAYRLADYYFENLSVLNTYWKQILIAAKNNYFTWKNYKERAMKDWIDMLGIMRDLGKDITNPKLILPDNLKHQHNKYVAKRRAMNRKIEREELIQSIDKYEPIYAEKKKDFIGKVIKKDNVIIYPLPNVKSFIEEDERMGHCVFVNKYFNKKSLILTSEIDGEPAETIELDVEKRKILQARGYNNEEHPQHKLIERVLKQNMKILFV